MISANYDPEDAWESALAAFDDFAGGKAFMLLEDYMAYLARGMLFSARVDRRTGTVILHDGQGAKGVAGDGPPKAVVPKRQGVQLPRSTTLMLRNA